MQCLYVLQEKEEEEVKEKRVLWNDQCHSPLYCKNTMSHLPEKVNQVT